MQKIVGLKEFRIHVDTYSKRVRAGESFLILKRSEPLFRIVPITDTENDWEEVIDFTKLKKGGIELSALLKRLWYG